LTGGEHEVVAQGAIRVGGRLDPLDRQIERAVALVKRPERGPFSIGTWARGESGARHGDRHHRRSTVR
jgi:hypothetical protein